MIQECMLDFRGQLVLFFSLAEFSYNNNYLLSILTAPFEVLYGRHCQSLVGWFKVSEPRRHGIRQATGVYI